MRLSRITNLALQRLSDLRPNKHLAMSVEVIGLQLLKMQAEF